MKHWKAELPLHDKHQLDDEAIEQLVELLPGTQVTFTDYDNVVGSVADAERIPANRARVTLRFQDHDEDAEKAVELLEAGELRPGLDMTVSDCRRALDGSHIRVGKVTALRSVMLVYEGTPARYTDGKGHRTTDLAAHASDMPPEAA